jgi:hypothetical protein
MKMLKGDLVMELREQLTFYRGILLQKLAGVQEKEEIIEIMLILAVGMLAGLYNPHQVAQQLEISPQAFYEKLKAMNEKQIRELLESMMMDVALVRLKQYQELSAASRSRLEVSITVDDSLIKRLGKALAYVWSWYSGQIHQVTTGQDLLGIVLKVGKEIIPLKLVMVSKQGDDNTEKPKLLLTEMTALKASFLQDGIDITNLGVSFDSWWLSEDLSEKLTALGFHKQVICAKSNTQLKIGKERKSIAEHFFDNELKSGWGHTTPARRLIGTNPTLGKVVVVLFNVARSKAFAILIPDAPLRTCEALRIWLNHPAVETFWKRLKQWLGHGKMQLQKSSGAWAELCLRVLAYFLAMRLFDNQVRTLNQLYHWLRRQKTFIDLIREHFQPSFLSTYEVACA